ncbi:MAG: hypothetical protein AABX11_01795 [Nanoarchaeota archaeon]
MPIDMNSAARTKDMILSFIKMRGPSLPITIARDVKTSTLFASAFLSELYQERKLRMSHLKVGSTSLYLIPGQEQMLENFIQYLNHKEQEAFHLIKQHGSLKEEELAPAIRVAIKEIKDFAIPVQENQKVIWKYAFAKESLPQQVHTLQPSALLAPNPAIPVSVQQAVETQLSSQLAQESLSQSNPPTRDELVSQVESAIQKIEEKPIKEKKEKIKKEIIKPNFEFNLTKVIEEVPEIIETPFGKNVRKYCHDKNLEIIKIEEEKKKEFTAILSLQTPMGKQNYYCIARDKKKINEQDIQQSLEIAQKHRMPALLLISAPLDKKGLALISDWQHLIKVDKLKI